MCMRDYLEQRAGGGLWEGGTATEAGSEREKVEDSGRPRPGEMAAPSESEERMARLVRTIEGEIVPRLVLTRRVSKDWEVSEGVIKAPDASDVAELVRLLLAHDADVAAGYVEAVRHRGASLEVVCLELLAPAARELGLLWEQDECDFMQVTVGLCRLHQVLRDISAEWRADEAPPASERTILLAPIPGEQHTFGIMLVAQFLRRAGWDVWHEFPDTLGDMLEVVRHNWFAVVGLSVGSDSRLEDVAAIIRSIRSGSRNRAVGVLVGGPVLVTHPEVAGVVGADATAADGRQAVIQAEHMCSALAAAH